MDKQGSPEKPQLTQYFDFQRLPTAWGGAVGKALFRCQPEDFQVDEVFGPDEVGNDLGFDFSGEGEHLVLHIRKRDQNTQWVAGLLAKLAGVKRNDVSFCGLKDRFAVTTQWFSVYLPGREVTLEQLQHDDLEILSCGRHNRKLRRGMHRGNQFRIVLRDFQASRDDVEGRLRTIAEKGVPNYFGEQRFGHNGGNLLEAQKLVQQNRLKGDRKNSGKNRKGSALYLSAARSWLFNLVLAQRIKDKSWQQPLAGEDIVTGPLWGRGRNPVSAEAAAFEADILCDWQSWCHALEHAGLNQERRELTLVPRRLNWFWAGESQLVLEFYLPTGCFATVILRELTQLSRPSFQVL